MNDAKLIAQGDRSYYEAWSLLARTAEGGDVREEDGLLIASPGSEVLWLNIAFVTRPLAEPEVQLATAKAFFAERGLRFLVRIREGLDEGSERACERLEMPYTDTIPGMLLAPVPAMPAPALEVREVDAVSFDDFVALNAAAFEIPLASARRIITRGMIDAPNSRWFLGFADGRAVATSALIVSEGIAGVHFVSTEAASRRRGIGEAMTWQAVRAGRERGLAAAYLQASEMGYPVYERMGFRRVAGYKTFVPREFL